jgi:phage-related protein
MSEKNNSLIQSIYNAGMLEAPLEITIKAFGEVINPSITNVYTQEMIQLNTTLATGDEVVINTGRKKEVSRWRNGVKENFYYSLDLNSDFILLHVGDNIFRFSATSGTQFMQVLMGFQERMGGI